MSNQLECGIVYTSLLVIRFVFLATCVVGLDPLVDVNYTRLATMLLSTHSEAVLSFALFEISPPMVVFLLIGIAWLPLALKVMIRKTGLINGGVYAVKIKALLCLWDRGNSLGCDLFSALATPD